MDDRVEDVEDSLRRRTRQMESLADLGQRAIEGVGLSALVAQACVCLAEDVDASWCAVLEPHEGSLVQRGEPPAWGADLVHLAATEGQTEIGDDRIVLPIRGLGAVAVAAPRGGTLSRQDLYFVRTVAHLLGAAGQREQHERALRAASERMEQALRASKAGAWESDLQRRKYHWSPELRQLLGLGEGDEPSEQLWQELLHPDDRERAHRASRAVVEQGSTSTSKCA
jgi:PAS domain-containing protein